MKAPTHNRSIRALTFRRCGLPFGIDVANVREIRGFDYFRPLALGIHPLVGLVSLDERILPVFDPHAFGSGRRLPVRHPLITVICVHRDFEFGIVADEIVDQIELGSNITIRRPSGSASWLHGEVQNGAGRKLLLLAATQIARLSARSTIAEASLATAETNA
jgi:chemotaxis signal transduction protein